jgi:hypothetical protein
VGGWHYLKRQCHQELLTLRGHRDILFGLDLSPDGRLLATGGRDWAIQFWDASTGREVRRLSEQPSPFAAVAFSPDGARLAILDTAGRVSSVASPMALSSARWSVGLGLSGAWPGTPTGGFWRWRPAPESACGTLPGVRSRANSSYRPRIPTPLPSARRASARCWRL